MQDTSNKRSLAVFPAVSRHDGDAEHLQSLAELSRVALISSSLDEVVDAGMAALVRGLDVDYAKLLHLLDRRAGLKLHWGVGWNRGYVGEAVVTPGAGSQAGYTLAHSGPVVVEDFRRETRFQAPALLLQHRVQSGMSITVRGSAEPFGVIGVHCRNRRCFSTSEVVFLGCVADIISTVVTHHAHSLRDARAGSSAAPSGSTRVLRGWKEIATYMGSGVRTAQRWERNYALPVHRPAARLKSSVVASTSELDAWIREAPTRHGE